MIHFDSWFLRVSVHRDQEGITKELRSLQEKCVSEAPHITRRLGESKTGTRD